MKKDITSKRQFLIDRLGYLRARANLSARELSQRIDKSIAYMAKFDNGDFGILGKPSGGNPSDNLAPNVFFLSRQQASDGQFVKQQILQAKQNKKKDSCWFRI